MPPKKAPKKPSHKPGAPADDGEAANMLGALHNLESEIKAEMEVSTILRRYS